jgi:hypothetical protein
MKKAMDIDELRLIISEQIDKVRNGEGDVKVANAVANLIGKTLKTVSLEMEYSLHKKNGGKKIDIME